MLPTFKQGNITEEYEEAVKQPQDKKAKEADHYAGLAGGAVKALQDADGQCRCQVR